MEDKKKTCQDCKHFMVAPTNPFRGTCTVNRGKLADSQAATMFIPGKLMKGETPACDKFEQSAGWEDSVKHTL